MKPPYKTTLQLAEWQAAYIAGLSYKRERCRLATQHYLSVTPRNGKYDAELARRKRAFESEFLSIKPE